METRKDLKISTLFPPDEGYVELGVDTEAGGWEVGGVVMLGMLVVWREGVESVRFG
jgi:hypothetical protein